MHHVALSFSHIFLLPSSSSSGKQLGLCMVWVLSSRLCFYLLVALRIYRAVMVLSLRGDAGRVFLWVMLLSKSQPFRSQVEQCWEVLAPGFSSALSGFIYR